MTLPEPYWRDEGVVLYHADCLDLLPLIANKSIDCVLTDPPYARDVYLRAKAWADGHVGELETGRFNGRGSRVSTGKGIVHGTPSRSLAAMAHGAIGSIDDLLAPVAYEIGRVVRRWSIVFSDAESTHRWRFNLEAAGLEYVRTGAWVKPDPLPQMSGDRPAVGFEPATICHPPGRKRWNGGGLPAVWTHCVVKGQPGRPKPEHPCPKPLALIRELVRLFTDPGDLILDPFAGSGTLGLAARLEGRRAILVEREERYCDVARRRLADLPLDDLRTGQQALFGEGT